MLNAIADWAAALIAILVALLLGGCVVSKQHDVPWSQYEVIIEGKPTGLEFRNYRATRGTWTHKIVTCRTLSGVKFCN